MKKFYTTLLAAALFCASASAQALYFKGDGEGLSWDEGNDLKVELKDGKYTVTINSLMKFKMSTSPSTVDVIDEVPVGGWNAFDEAAYMLTTAVEKSNLGTPLALEKGSQDITMPWKGDYTIVVNEAITEITLTTTTPEPTDLAIYLRGGMNNWGNDPGSLDAWQFTFHGNGKYTFTCAEDQIIAANTELKIADAEWGSANWGNGLQRIECDGSEYKWGFSAGNSVMTEDWSGTVTVNLNAEGCGFGKDAMVTFSDPLEDGVNSVRVENAEKEYFNLQGVRVANPENGLYIVRQGAKTSKVLVK